MHPWMPSAEPSGPPRADSCLLPVCPWCILRAIHGDEESAARQAEEAMNVIAAGATQGHSTYIIKHALMWCQKICQQDARTGGASTSWQVKEETTQEYAGLTTVHVREMSWSSQQFAPDHAASGSQSCGSQSRGPPPRLPSAAFRARGSLANDVHWGPRGSPHPGPSLSGRRV